MTSINPKVALVTGSDGGIGTELVSRLTREGYAVVAATQTSGDWRADVSDAEQCQDLVRRTVDRHGRLDLLVNNAATMDLKAITDHDFADWWHIIQVNLSGPFFLSQASAPHLARHSGCIVNMSSRIAIAGGAGATAYASSKAGLIGLTKSLALELAPRVRVNAVAPGAVDTSQLRYDAALAGMPLEAYRAMIVEQTPLKRIATPADVAETVVFLASEMAQHYTGQIFSLNGGTLLP